ncbi:hypothetical protein O9929_01600 [Vibrio lentus]|nr:hypothetical protein [Vibrio lentus]
MEAVADRFKVCPDLQQRLMESSETTLELSGGIAVVGWMMTQNKKRSCSLQTSLVQSVAIACKNSSPRLFSFNNPAGARYV